MGSSLLYFYTHIRQEDEDNEDSGCEDWKHLVRLRIGTRVHCVLTPLSTQPHIGKPIRPDRNPEHNSEKQNDSNSTVIAVNLRA
jgi:hypothetical protein